MGTDLGEGSWAFWTGHDHADWASNASEYDLGTFTNHDADVEVKLRKAPDHVLHVSLAVHGRSFKHQHVMSSLVPEVSPEGAIHLAVEWTPKVVKLYLGGERVAVFQV